MRNRSYECGEKLKFYGGLWRKTEAKVKDKKLKECKRSTQARRTDIGRFICLAEHVNF
jgi:hypothetical protein